MVKGDEYVNKYFLKSLEVFVLIGEFWNFDLWMWLFEMVGKGNVLICNYLGGIEIFGGIFGNVFIKLIVLISFNVFLLGMVVVVLDD